MMNFRRKKQYRDYDINPDEIFMDTMNVSNLDQQQFEGVIEQRIPKKTLSLAIGVTILVGIIFGIQLFKLQIVQGEAFSQQAESNRLNNQPIFAERGIIYDRNLQELAWNIKKDNQPYLSRAYIPEPGYGHLLGYVNYPEKDDNGNYWRHSIEGQDGLEEEYNDVLKGENGAQLYEVNALGERISQQFLRQPQPGQNLVTTIDARLQGPLFSAIKKQAEEAQFQGGAGVIMNVNTGALLAFTSYPEYDPYILAKGTEKETIQGFFNDPAKPFLNRVTSGLYSPGSTVKPFLALAALNEGLITDQTRIISTGRIVIPNPYNLSKPSIFRDWRPEGHGLTDVYHAIADSVNTFFYAIGGGYENQEGLGIARINEYLSNFGIAQTTGIDFESEATGVIPNPEWKDEHFADGTWRLGDTYNTSIGQFGFQVTPIQMARSFALIANSGKLFTPFLIADTEPSYITPVEGISLKHFQVIRRAMRQTVTEGTAALLYIPEVTIAAKTGTAQVGRNNEYKNSWAVGFFPYEKPQYSFALVMERAPNTEANNGSAARAFKDFLTTVTEQSPEFWKEI